MSKNNHLFPHKALQSNQVRQLMRLRNTPYQGQTLIVQNQSRGFKIKGEHINSQIIQHEFTNHQSSSKICPQLLDNIQSSTNQVYVFSGDQQQRLETFLGSSSDPGMLMVIMVYLMQQKYKLGHGQLELKVSFLEFNNNQFLDLLTQEKLIIKQMELCCWVKVNEYLQYLKAVKIALYANKKRDFRVFKFDDEKQSKDSSLLICRIRAKFNDKTSEVILIDVPTLRRKEKLRNCWQSFMYSFKQGTKVESTQFTEFLNQKLKKGVLTVIYSMNLSAQKALFNIARLKQIQQFCSLNPLSSIKSKHISNLSNIRVLSKISLHQKVSSLILRIKTINYDSVNHLQSNINHLLEWKRICLIKMNQLGNIILNLLQNRISMTIFNNSSFFERRQLVGKSVKSQNLKDFYSAKTYQSLYREVDIKTQESKKNLKNFVKQNMEFKLKFIQSKSKILPKSQNEDISLILKDIEKIIQSYFMKQYLSLKQDTPSYTLALCIKKVEVQQKMKQFQNSIEFLRSDLQNINVSGCNFKQDLIISKRNLVQKVKMFADFSIQKTNSLPKLLFKKIDNTLKQQQPKIQMKLSDYLLKLPIKK